jgi:hypothetical protein
LRFGFIQGGFLTPERALRPDVTTLVAFDDNQERQEWQTEEEVFMKESLAQAFDQES